VDSGPTGELAMTTYDDVDDGDDRQDLVIDQKASWFSNAPWAALNNHPRSSFS
jgi:hypothetical protein